MSRTENCLRLTAHCLLFNDRQRFIDARMWTRYDMNANELADAARCSCSGISRFAANEDNRPPHNVVPASSTRVDPPIPGITITRCVNGNRFRANSSSPHISPPKSPQPWRLECGKSPCRHTDYQEIFKHPRPVAPAASGAERHVRTAHATRQPP